MSCVEDVIDFSLRYFCILLWSFSFTRSYYIFSPHNLQACGDIDEHFKSKIMEPCLIIFEEDNSVVQMFIAGEDDNLMELPVTTIGEGIVYLMAAYHVFSVT